MRQLSLYLRNKGFYNAQVMDSVKFRKQHAQVTYDIRTGDPYTIRSISYHLEDTSIRSLFYPDTVNTRIERGDHFDIDLLESERMRIENLFRNQGYFNFNHEYVYYTVDSAVGDHQVDLTLGIKRYMIASPDGYYLTVPHRKYKVEEVYIYPNYDQKQALTDNQGYIDGLNRLEFNDFIFLHEGKLRANANVISQSVFILPGEYYEQEKVRQTHKHLTSLRIYKLVNIIFEEKDPYDEVQRDYYPLVCHIQLIPANSQSYTIELEGTNSYGNLGAGGNLNYMHRNLFGGAENFSARISGAIETITKSEADRGFMMELGSEARLSLPQFLLPFKTEDFIRKYDPKTNFLIAYNYQRRPDYTRSLMQTSFGYSWSANDLITHIMSPLTLNYVKMISVSDTFRTLIKDTYLEHSYEDQLILGTNYSLIFSNQKLRKSSDFMFFRFNLESSGFLLSGIARAARVPEDTLGRHLVFSNAFSQYVKGDIEFRWYKPLNDKTSMVYRFFAGLARPYGNSLAIPFEKQYFSGGANGVRAWNVRDLGPGSYLDTTKYDYPNKTADIKLEANFEYRFKLFWLLEGALFVDAGNIWTVHPDSEREGANFEWDRFYKEIAVGSGFGLRLDFSYFVFRTDIGFKLRDPVRDKIENLTPQDQTKYTKKPYTIHWAIGYPF